MSTCTGVSILLDCAIKRSAETRSAAEYNAASMRGAASATEHAAGSARGSGTATEHGAASATETIPAAVDR